MSDHNIESHIKVYWNVFFALIAFTILTVAVSYYDFGSVFWTLFVGLGIACIKGYAVAGYFMHLNDERKPIYYILALSVAFLVVLMSIPMAWRSSGESHEAEYIQYIDQDAKDIGGYVIHKEPEHNDNSHDNGGH